VALLSRQNSPHAVADDEQRLRGALDTFYRGRKRRM